MNRRTPLALAVAATTAITVAACGSTDTPVASTSDSVTITNCTGASTTLATRPTRIATANTAGLELLIRLGATDKVIGTGFSAGAATLPTDVRGAATAVPSLGTRGIPKETLLTSGADAFLDAFGQMQMMGGDSPTEQDFQNARIAHVFLKSSACASVSPTKRTTLREIFGDITTLGDLSGTQPRAAEMIDSMKKTIDTGRSTAGLPPVDASADNVDLPPSAPSVFYYSPDPTNAGLTTIGNSQVGNGIYTLAGVRNVFGDRTQPFAAVSWEDVLAADPDYVQVAVRNQPDDAAQKAAEDRAVEQLRTDPRSSGLRAVREGHIIVLGAEETTLPGVANADTIAALAAATHPKP